MPAENDANYYNSAIISELINFPYPEHIASFHPVALCFSSRNSVFFQTWVPEIVPPTKGFGGYGDYSCSFLALGDKFLGWQASLYRA
jgi:hypothetical protein